MHYLSILLFFLLFFLFAVGVYFPAPNEPLSIVSIDSGAILSSADGEPFSFVLNCTNLDIIPGTRLSRTGWAGGYTLTGLKKVADKLPKGVRLAGKITLHLSFLFFLSFFLLDCFIELVSSSKSAIGFNGSMDLGSLPNDSHSRSGAASTTSFTPSNRASHAIEPVPLALANSTTPNADGARALQGAVCVSPRERETVQVWVSTSNSRIILDEPACV